LNPWVAILNSKFSGENMSSCENLGFQRCPRVFFGVLTSNDG
jgi:hypothetical protein